MIWLWLSLWIGDTRSEDTTETTVLLADSKDDILKAVLLGTPPVGVATGVVRDCIDDERSLTTVDSMLDIEDDSLLMPALLDSRASEALFVD